jgi:hypothetical protein
MTKITLLLSILATVVLFGCINFGETPQQQNDNTTIENTQCVGCYSENNSNASIIPTNENQTKPAENNTEQPGALTNQTNQTINQTAVANQTGNKTVIENTSGCSGPGPSSYDILTKGTVTSQGQTYEDVCIVYNVVKEYYCKDGNVRDVNVDCPGGYWCKNGSCIKFVGSCDDSDGRDPAVKGRITVITGPFTSEIKEDECVDDGYVKEQLCSGPTAYTENIYCGAGRKCSDGRCITSKCNETDGGDVPEVFGGTSVGNVTQKDSCFDDYKLREYYCYGDNIQSREYLCKDRCRDDQCVPVG